jgi:hypothetical protein
MCAHPYRVGQLERCQCLQQHVTADRSPLDGNQDLRNEQPWGLLAELTNVQQLTLIVSASGDPSPLSALTRLSSLSLRSCEFEGEEQTPFGFSSLQPLSTLQHLEVLYLGIHACTATSLQGLAGLGNL